jgi:hypothetical protein
MNLLVTQRNELFETIKKSRFSPENFEIVTYATGDIKIKFNLGKEEYYCEMDFSDNPFRRKVLTVPGNKQFKEIYNPKDWPGYLGAFKFWITNLEREHHIEDLWDILYQKMNVPDDNLTIANSTVKTNWEEVNKGQKKLVEMLSNSQDTFDFQNIGNTSRKIIELLASAVFDPSVHISDDPSVKVSEGKFKNQLHTYIKFQLKGSSNDALRNYAFASVAAVETAIDLANSLTHKTSADRKIAEACIISVVATISIIKLIHN